MSAVVRLVLRGITYATAGALGGAALGLLTVLPDVITALAPDGAAARPARVLVLGVALACLRLGAVVGLIAFLLKRALTGEIADPRLHPHRRPPGS